MAMEEGVLEPGELYWLDDEEFFSRFPGQRYAPFELISRVACRSLYKTAYETAYDPDRHASYLSLSSRLAECERIAASLSRHLASTVAPWEILVDIPEPISFEVELPIIDGERSVPFTGSGSVFSRPVVDGFSASMRMLRVFTPAALVQKVRPHLESLI
jgi:hypothetical protein